MTDKLEVALAAGLANCARCGEDHEGPLEWHAFMRPVDKFMYWAACPISGDPILLQVGVPVSDLTDEDDFNHYFNATRRLSIENERLRAALERLVDIGPSATLKEWRDAQAAGAQVLGR